MSSAAPRWKTALTKGLEKSKMAVFQLATVDPNGSPHVRSCINREFIAPQNFPSLPLLVSTTDTRTPKVTQILSQTRVETVFWVEGTMEQYRISGFASVIPAPSHALYHHFESSRGPAFAALKDEGFDWEAKRREVFDYLGGHMRATWCRPIPGSEPESGHVDAKAWPESVCKLGEARTDQEKEHVDTAIERFALLVIDPEEVDYVELGVIPNQRTTFRRTEDGWVEKAVVP
ncbi:hypothetical protein SERLA73DRAFT_189460 [Serpula lacrymans var. lacrymans S7.3]|uniref:Pyridoxamine 5'-phosphate oxidase Alr4036 family FMN-binding domain-containing protein n=2 Tax=Serpula lacrymans var. lacrymans TaxID=341189 RepID=F8QDP9_SERL3|nr:uncharacterized protein SERLADRAFT_480284 [Serpula lacrymans var. lacrymans S7.9]EGN93720.1 hypothetical protein SERLA73DRAFT_189460 [Serpula lacrymans var. lacrymans S7.3]EGO19090.1 hypothetical protein SERLADRAFT_480284 [Serpula lacrymans var. lacrymans S7.9]